MSDPLWIRELTVRRMPGFPTGGIGLSDLCAGINLVRGPNASGKTTAARAIQALLWRAGVEDASLLARFRLGEEPWVVDLDGTRVQWERDGRPSGAPPLPAAETRSRYFLSLHELLRVEDRDLADLVRVETAGGYDVPARAEALGFGTRGRPHNATSALADARRALAEARDDARRLRDERRELEDLRHRLSELEEVAGRARELERARDLARAGDAVARASGALDAFPAVLGLLGGDEAERLEAWRSEEAEAREARTAGEADVRRADEALAEAGLGDREVEKTLLRELEEKVERARTLERDAAAASRELAAARATRREADEALGSAGRTEEAGDREAPAPARLDELLRRAEKLRARRAEAEARLRELDAADAASARGEEAAPLESLQEGLRLLREWLRAAGGDEEGERRRDRLVLAGAAGLILLGVAALALGLVSDPRSVGVAIAGGLAAALGLVLLAVRPRASADPRDALRAEAERLGHAPEAWTADAVRARVDTLEKEVARRRLAEARDAERTRLRADLEEIEGAEDALAEERAGVAADLGLDHVPDDLSLHLLGTRLAARDAAAREESAARGRLESAREELERTLARGRDLLAPFGYAPGDADALAAARADLAERRETHESARRDLAEARRRVSAATEALEAVAGRRARLFERLGLDPEEGESELRALGGRLEAYREAERELEGARRDRATARAALEELAGDADAPARALLDDDPGPESLDDLERRLGEAREAATDARDVRDRISAIEGALREARRKHDVEEALAREDEARSGLEDRRQEDLEAEVGDVLAAWVRSRSSERNRPAVFYHARDLLVEITRGRYELEMSRDEPAAFRAFDTEAGRGRALDELSAGTRLQLLLAVRIAFVETQESGARLPLLLDEVLANCDDHRARAIIDAAASLARNGRQVFYFTAQADELAKWREVLDGSDVAWVERGLAGPGDDDAGFRWTARPVEAAALPDPDGMSHDRYGRALGVPAFDPWAEGVGALHLWYLVDDPCTLHELLRAGISTWGQLETYATRAGDDAAPAVRAAAEAARGRALVCRRFAELWRRGRGRPVDRATLLASDAVSESFIDEVTDLCSELGGRGEALLAALEEGRVARFRTRMIERLRVFLLDEGHISEEEPLEDEDLLLRLAAEARRFPGAPDRAEVDALVTRLATGPDAP